MIQNIFRSTAAATARAGSADSLNYSYSISLGESATAQATVFAKNPTVVMTVVSSVYTFYKILFVVEGTAYLSAPFNPANGTTYKNVSSGKLIVISNTPNPQISVTEES